VNISIGGSISGTGFVVTEDGLIFTNKHVAAGWKINFDAFSDYMHGHGIVYEVQPKAWDDTDPKQKQEHASWMKDHPPVDLDFRDNPREFHDLLNWRPEEGGPVFANDAAIVVGNGANDFVGRNMTLAVQFPGERLEWGAQLAGASSGTDAALIKIDMPQKLAAVTLASNDHVDRDERVTVLGYPPAFFKTRDDHEVLRKRAERLPEPTVTIGNVSSTGRPALHDGDTASGYEVIVRSMAEDIYQIDLPGGARNSGGPVFDAEGEVVGLATYLDGSDQTYAVPIHYARAFRLQQKQ
jgi:S1-C subfamily serine protease